MIEMTDRNIRAFGAALDHLDTRWRKTPPVRVAWYKPPPRSTLPLLRYAVNPRKTMILKVMICPPELEDPCPISVALFGIDGRFMYDTSFALDEVEKATAWLRRLFAEKSVVEVAEQNGKWAGAYCGKPNGHLPGLRAVPAFTRSWLGTYDTA
jgi:hypothetical protein